MSGNHVLDLNLNVGAFDAEAALFGVKGWVKLAEEDKQHDFIKRSIHLQTPRPCLPVQIEAIRRNVFAGITSRARLHSYQMFEEATKHKNAGYNNVRMAWFGGSKDEIKTIMKHGFGAKTTIPAVGNYGRGISLPAFQQPHAGMLSSLADNDGLKHVILGRVIVGRAEEVHPGSTQTCPSSEGFDSGVDDLSSPQNYIVWGTNVNTHILPQFVVSFRSSPSCSCNLNEAVGKKIVLANSSPPSSMNFPKLIAEIEKVMPSGSVSVVRKSYKEHRENKITRRAFVEQLRRVVGDELLIGLVKSLRFNFNAPRKLAPKDCKHQPSNYEKKIVITRKAPPQTASSEGNWKRLDLTKNVVVRQTPNASFKG